MRYVATMADTMPIPLGYLLGDPETKPAAVSRIHEAIREHGNLTAAAKALGVTYRQLCRWRDEYGTDVIPAGVPGNPALTNRDTHVIEKPAEPRNRDKRVIAKTSQSRTTVTSVSGSEAARWQKPRRMPTGKR